MDELDRLKELADSLSVTSQKTTFDCYQCQKKYQHKRDLVRHRRAIHEKIEHRCENCTKSFNRRDKLNEHTKKCKKTEFTVNSRTSKRKATVTSDEPPSKKQCTETCNWCGHTKVLLPGKKFCSGCSENARECKWCHRPLPERFYGKRTDVCDSCVTRRDNYVQRGGGTLKSALEGTVETSTLEPNPGNLWDLLQFFVDNLDHIKEILLDTLKQKTGIKWFVTVKVKFVKYNENNEPVYAEPTFRSYTSTLTNVSDIEEEIASTFRKLYIDYQNFERDGSGWSIDKIIQLEVNTAEYTPLTGSSYIPLPEHIANKHGILNIQNNDQKCFVYSVLAALYPVKDNPHRVSNYIRYETDLKYDNIEMPVSLSDISKFEKQNNISINVFGLEKKDVYPLRITDSRFNHHINLLLISKGEQRHYCLIKSMSRLLGDRTNHDGKTFYCNYCLHGYSTQERLNAHIPDCKIHGAQKVSFPKEEDQWIRFNSLNKQLRVPFVIYADFESILRPISGCENKQDKSSTTRHQQHEPSGFCYVIKCTNEELSKPAKVYRGPNVIETFLDCLMEEEEQISDLLDRVAPMKLNEEEENQFQEAELCHVCQQELGDDRVRDHDHLTGMYRGPAHSLCNIQLQFRKAKTSKSSYSKYFLPVVFHNMSNYDLHHIISVVGKYKDRKLSCIPNNMEKYISFSMDNIRFIDSMHFMNTSLEKLVENLADMGREKFKTLASHFRKEEELDLLLRKGVYPYDYMENESKFKEEKLPPASAFYNKLKDENISQKDYEHAETVWKVFNIQNMGEYHDLYMKSDVLLLCDVFQAFRQVCFSNYSLDPLHYFTAPGLSWDAMLKMTGVELQLLDDIDMIHMIQKGVRGGVSMISQKFAKANNPETLDYNPEEKTTWITYLDMNNLYGTAMIEPLPEKDFEWVPEDQLSTLDVNNISDDDDVGYILEVDLNYPQELHDIHNDYPLAPESMIVTDQMHSEHTRNLKKKLNLKGKPSQKLVPNLSNKSKYVVHYRTHKLYIQYGMKISKIHRAIRFTQSLWLKQYVDFNTEMRKNARNTFEKDFYKLLINSIYGKFLENIFKRMNVELVQTKKRMKKLCAKPNFTSYKIFNDDLVAVNTKKTNLIFNKPIYAGFSILDISKLLMYKFHYGYMKNKYGNRTQMLFTDTDSLTYHTETENIYEDMLENKEYFDMSNFDKKHPMYDVTHAKELGRMKDECGGNVVDEFVGLKAKMYSLSYQVRTKDEDKITKEKKTAKGVAKAVLEKQLKHDSYKECLFDQTSLRHKMSFIRSDLHNLYTITVNKKSLSSFDDKRYVLDDGFHTLAHGHYRIAYDSCV